MSARSWLLASAVHVALTFEDGCTVRVASPRPSATFSAFGKTLGSLGASLSSGAAAAASTAAAAAAAAATSAASLVATVVDVGGRQVALRRQLAEGGFSEVFLVYDVTGDGGAGAAKRRRVGC